KKHIREMAKTLGISPDMIYRQLQKQRGKMKKIARAKDVPQAYIDAVARLKAKSLSFGTVPRELSTERCIAILEQNGIIPKGQLSTSTVNRRLKDEGFRTPKPVVRYEADYVNQCQQLDFSRSKYFELLEYDADKDDYILIVNTRSYVTKKDDGKKLRLWLAQLVDEKSRASLKRYYAAAGENTFMGLDFLQFCWGREEDAHPLRYIPDYLKSDNGSFMKSEEAQNMLLALKIEWLRITPSNSKSSGKIERRWRTLWQGWELEMAVRLGDKATIYMSEFNDMIHQECINDLQKPHPRTKSQSVGHVYKTGLVAHPPRQVDLDTMRIACRVLERRVGPDCRLTIDNVELCAPEEYARKKIRVYRNLDGEYVGEAIDDKSQRFPIVPFESQSFLQYKSYSETRQETALKEYEATGMQEQIAKAPAPAQDAPGNVKYLKPAVQHTQPETPFSGEKKRAFANLDAAKMHIGRQLRSSYADYAETFDPILEQTLDIDIIEGVIATIRKQRLAI
ncbi:MAG TPA: transposase, partial [Gammaproteobacteria bacterium]|nr:transposase [Gammaproteobacteria bacterium]